jgi:hypothetical protein
MGSGLGKHLTPEQLVDAAEDLRAPSVDRHLSACPACQARLADLRSMVSSVGQLVGEVPDPSPLFWNTFQRRVVEAAEAERQNEGAIARFLRSLRPAILVPAAAALLVAAAVLVTRTVRTPDAPAMVTSAQASMTAVQSATPSAPADLLRDSMDDDPPLQLLADLAVDVDWTAADAVALAPNGSAEHAVSHLDANDLKELQRLLRAELGT